MWQHMVFSEYLPIILGPRVMDEMGLTLQGQGYWNGSFNRHTYIFYMTS